MWIAHRVEERKIRYNLELQPGLLSILTAIWDGSPVTYLELLAKSLALQNSQGACEWVLLDNGCSRREIIRCLDALRKHTWIKIHRAEENLGIIRGLRYCLERATGRYILPVDGDDHLYPDALGIVTAYLDKAGYPPILYTDEDKMTERGVSQPYFKPDWDPVLLGNSAYIAHLGVIDRQEALRLGAYSDPCTEGSPDWDLFLRFAAAGHLGIRIPEVVYSWRMHASSTADDAASKGYILSSQRAALQRFLEAKRATDQFSTENSPFFPNAAHWHFARRQGASISAGRVLLAGEKTLEPPTTIPGDRKFGTSLCIPATSEARSLMSLANEYADQDGLLCFLSLDLQVDNDGWLSEALGLFELFRDTVMVGGRICDARGQLVDAGQQLGFRGTCESPDGGRKDNDPGYFGQAWKQRSVGAVSTQCSVVKASFLAETLGSIPAGATTAYLGAWLGAHALRTKKRIVYTPFLGGISGTNWDQYITSEERSLFASANRDILPDRRYYPEPFSLKTGYVLATDESGKVKTSKRAKYQQP